MFLFQYFFLFLELLAISSCKKESPQPNSNGTEANQTLANQSYFNTGDDTSDPAIDRYYKSATNLPWAINIFYNFVWPLESKEITLGYLKFGNWAESGDTLYQDWYKDLPDYRDNSYLDN